MIIKVSKLPTHKTENRIGSRRTVKCPICGSDYVHQDEPYRVLEEGNRYEDRVPMWSELCNHTWEMVIHHWKGQTEMCFERTSPKPKEFTSPTPWQSFCRPPQPGAALDAEFDRFVADNPGL